MWQCQTNADYEKNIWFIYYIRFSGMFHYGMKHKEASIVANGDDITKFA